MKAEESAYSSLENIFLFAPPSHHESFWHIREALQDMVLSVEEVVKQKGGMTGIERIRFEDVHVAEDIPYECDDTTAVCGVCNDLVVAVESSYATEPGLFDYSGELHNIYLTRDEIEHVITVFNWQPVSLSDPQSAFSWQ